VQQNEHSALYTTHRASAPTQTVISDTFGTDTVVKTGVWKLSSCHSLHELMERTSSDGMVHITILV
jgi:hypothetical protein